MQVYWDNTVRSWLLFTAVILLGALSRRFLGKWISKAAYRFFRKKQGLTPASYSIMQFYNGLRQPVEYLLMYLYVYVAFNFLHWPQYWLDAAADWLDLRAAGHFLYRVCFIYVCTFIALRVLTYVVDSMEAGTYTSEGNRKTSPQATMFLREAGRIFIYIVALLTFLGYALGRDVGAILGGLGIGGLALAFAAKETLENLIASVIIFLDKPFSVGDTIEIDGITGSVELVGLRSTRIRTFERTLVSIPNRKMVDSPLNNLSLRSEFRVRQMVGLHHKTPTPVLNDIILRIETYLKAHPLTTDETYLYVTRMEDQGLYLMVQYYTISMEGNVHWKAQHEVNIFINDLFAELGIEFAELVVK